MPILVLLPIVVILNFVLAWRAKGLSRIGNAFAGTMGLLIWLWYAGELFTIGF